MSMRCCSASSLGGYFVIGAGCFVAGVIGTRAFDAAPTAQPLEAASPFTGQVINADFTQPEDAMDPGMMMEMMKEWAATTEQHKLLENMAGEWDCETSFSMGGPEPVKGTGFTRSNMILGGRYVTQHFTMPDFMGMEFEGMGAVGYDKAKGKFVNVWMDNMSTGFMTMEGTYDEDTDTLTWEGEATYPAGPGQTATVPVKHIVKNVSTDKAMMEFWEPNPMTGEMHNSGTITYTRK
jgi:hypothetical protein